MTTTTLYSNKNLFWTAYKNAVKSIKNIGIFYFAVSFISFPLMYFMQVLQDRAHAEALTFAGEGVKYTYRLCGSAKIYPAVSAIAYFAVLVLMTVLAGVMVNSFMHNKKAVDVFHALPIKRVQLMCANFLAVLTVVLVPMLCCYSLVALGNLFVQTATTFKIILEVLRLIPLILTMLSITFLCCAACCAAFDSGVFALALGVIVPCFAMLKMLTFDAMLLGYTSGTTMISSLKFSPIAMFYSTMLPSLDDKIFALAPTIYIGYLAFAAVVLALACLVYKNRKSELAQSFNTSGVIYQVVIIAASFGMAVILSIATRYLGTYEVRTTQGDWMIMALSAVYGGLLYLAINSILTHSFKQTKKSLITLAVCVASPLIFWGALIFTGWFGYETYLPKATDVENVTVGYVGTYGRVYYGTEEKNKHPQPHFTTTLTTAQGVEKVQEIHKSIIGDLQGDRISDGATTVYNACHILYKLKNGKVVERYYHGQVNIDTLNKITLLEEEPEFRAQHSPFALSQASDVRGFEIVDGLGKNYQMLNLTKAEVETLYTALQEDDKALSLEDKTNTKGILFSEVSVLYKKLENGEAKYQNVVVQLTDKYPNTLAALKALGLEEYAALPDTQKTKATVCLSEYSYYYEIENFSVTSGLSHGAKKFAEDIISSSAEQGELMESFTGEELAQILPKLQTYAYCGGTFSPLILVVLTDEDVAIQGANANDLEAGMYMMNYSDAPQFVKDAFKNQIGEVPNAGISLFE